MSPNGGGGWNEITLHSFTGGADGWYPFYSYVIFDSSGNLYGTAYAGGTDSGVVFELSPTGTSWSESVLYSFPGDYSGGPINGMIRDKAGNLYGPTYSGSVFELSPSGGGWTEGNIYNNGRFDFGGLVMDTAGNIYGPECGAGEQTGSVYELSPNGDGWNPTVLHKFTNYACPIGTPVLDRAGNLYGTTSGGGAHKDGTVYKLTPGGENEKWKLKTLYPFKGGNDGNQPFAGIVFDAAGNIYGTTVYGGTFDQGTVFELVRVGKTGYSYKEKVLWSFNGTDGAYPYASLTLDGAGNLYGTTVSGGSNGYGVVFEITP